MKKVFIDANILFYKIISDLFFDASVLGVIEVYWSQDVINEYLTHGPRVLNEISKTKGEELKLEKCVEHINKKVELFKVHSKFIMVSGYGSVSLNESEIKDKNDIHVYKGAKKANCNVLVTNDKEFKNVHLITDIDLVAKKADAFFCDLYKEHPEVVMDIINKTRQGIEAQRGTSIDLEEFIEEMKRRKLTMLASLIS